MARARVAVALMLLALCGLASGGRLLPGSVEGFFMRAMTLGHPRPHTANTESSPLGPTQLASDLEALLNVDGGHADMPLHIVAEIFSPPSIHHELIEEYMRMSEGIHHSKAKVYLSLNKPIGDNIKFVSYLYAESGCELRKMMECRAFQDFARFITDRNIAVAHQRLFMLGSSGRKSHNAAAAAAAEASDASAQLDADMASMFTQELPELDLSTCMADAKEVPEVEAGQLQGGADASYADAGKGPSHHVFRMVGLYNVPPGHGRKFAAAWKKLACKASRWQGHLDSSLFKVMGDNTGFVAYSAWEMRGRPSKKEQEDKWDALRKFREDIDDLGVRVHATPLFEIHPRK